jgi:hypothetical protein
VSCAPPSTAIVPRPRVNTPPTFQVVPARALAVPPLPTTRLPLCTWLAAPVNSSAPAVTVTAPSVPVVAKVCVPAPDLSRLPPPERLPLKLRWPLASSTVLLPVASQLPLPARPATVCTPTVRSVLPAASVTPPPWPSALMPAASSRPLATVMAPPKPVLSPPSASVPAPVLLQAVLPSSALFSTRLPALPTKTSAPLPARRSDCPSSVPVPPLSSACSRFR